MREITQNKINEEIITNFSEINEKLSEDNVFFEGDYSEMYVVLVNVTKDEAYWAIRLIDYRDAGVTDEAEGFQYEDLEAVKFYEGKNPKNKDEDWWFLKFYCF